MGIYDKEVSEKLGKEAVEEILKDAQSGHISPQQMDDVAKALEPPEILGNHKRRGNSGADEMREILSDWCQLSDSFHDMSGKDALCLLIRVFKEAPVSLKPLAYRLEKLLTKGKEYLEPQNLKFFLCAPAFNGFELLCEDTFYPGTPTSPSPSEGNDSDRYKQRSTPRDNHVMRYHSLERHRDESKPYKKDWISASRTSEQSDPPNLSSPYNSQRSYQNHSDTFIPGPFHQRQDSYQSLEPESPEVNQGGRSHVQHPDSTTLHAPLMQSPGSLSLAP